MTPPPLPTVPAPIFNGAHETELSQLGFRVLASTPSPASCFGNAQPHNHCYLIRTAKPSLFIAPRFYFQQHARNRAPAARLLAFGLNSSLSCVPLDRDPPSLKSGFPHLSQSPPTQILTLSPFINPNRARAGWFNLFFFPI